MPTSTFCYQHFAVLALSWICPCLWCCLVTQLRVTLCDPMDGHTPGFSVHHQLLEFALTHVHWVSDATQPSYPLSHSFSCPQSFPASIRVFSSELALCLKWPKYWSFSFRTSPSNEYSRIISFRIDCFDLLAAVQGILGQQEETSPTPQFKSIIFWCSAFFMVQLSHLYMTTQKTIALAIWIFVSKMFLLLKYI